MPLLMGTLPVAPVVLSQTIGQRWRDEALCYPKKLWREEDSEGVGRGMVEGHSQVPSVCSLLCIHMRMMTGRLCVFMELPGGKVFDGGQILVEFCPLTLLLCAAG